MKTTKEEYIKIIKSIIEKTTDVEDYSSIPISTYCYVEDELRHLEQLIHEYFDNPPLTLKELKQMIGEPVWDDCMNEWALVKEVGKCIVGDFVSLIDADGQEYSVYGNKVNLLHRKQVEE